jgi:diguanylate cyclase (GGDEF)-like protein
VRATFAAAMETTSGTDEDDGLSEWELVTAAGERRTIAWRHTVLRDGDGRATGALASGEDITDRLRAEAEIRRLAYCDPLTGLANRSQFDRELHAAVAAGEPVGLLFVDLDDFKVVNDTHGHGVGDELLRAVGGRLSALAGAELVGRHGGDEFLVLLPGLPEDACAAARVAAAAATERLGEPFGLSGHDVRIRASVGHAVFPHEAADADALLRRADDAMYRVKRQSRGREVGR